MVLQVGEISAEKNRLRKLFRAFRMNQPEAAYRKRSADIARELEAYVSARDPVQILAFWPDATRREPDFSPVLDAWRAKGTSVLLPRVSGARTMTFHPYLGTESLQRGAFGLMEPITPRALIRRDAVVLVPALGADLAGNRLGYGGGFYDLFLKTIPSSCHRVAVVYAEHVVAVLPSEPHDCVVHAVVSERGAQLCQTEGVF